MDFTDKKHPLISIIVPVYNIMEYLPRCVESLRQQTYENLEILLVDDGSTDGTGELCDTLAAGEERIRVFHKKNGGSSSARNFGIEQAKGAYLGFVDSDDYVDKEMYALLYEAIKTYHVKAAQIGRDEIDPQGNRLPDICVPPKEPECIPPEAFLRELLLHRGDCSFCTKLIAREVFIAVPQWRTSPDGKLSEELPEAKKAAKLRRFPEGMLNEDFRLLVQSLQDIGPIVSLPQQTYHVFYRVGSNSRKAGKESFSRVYADSVVNADMAADIVEEGYPQLSEIAFRFGIFQRLEYLLHIPISQMNSDNRMYRQIVSYLRRNWVKAMRNPILTKKNKLYHTLFAVAPKKIRQLHKKLRG